MSSNGSKTVFIGGSRRVSRLARALTERLDRIVDQGLGVVIGDANGADRAVQSYLAHAHYEKVTVFCMAGNCRNNVGGWPVEEISPPAHTRRDRSYFELKDRAMGRVADYGLMIWDGESRGTLANVADLAGQGKPVVVFVAPRREFITVRDAAQASSLVSAGAKGRGDGRSSQLPSELHPF